MKIDLEKVISEIDSYRYMCYPPHYPIISIWKELDIKKRKEYFKIISKYFNNPQERSCGLYVNVPFCASKCNFCFLDIIAYREKKEVENFIKGIEKETLLWREAGAKNHFISSIYLAGGTVSILNTGYLRRLFNSLEKNFNLTKCIQITVETSPEFITEEKIELFAQKKVNFIMMGIQSFNDDVIKKSNRIQSHSRIENAIKLIKKYAIKFNIDLICGLVPDVDEFLKEVMIASSFKPDMIHLNKLKPVYNHKEKEKIESMQKKAMLLLKKMGYTPVDEESAVLDGFEGNIQGKMEFQLSSNIIGIGPGSIGRIYSLFRYKNFFNTQNYLDNLANDIFAFEKAINLTEDDEITFYLLTRLTGEGIRIEEIKNRFSKKVVDKVIPEIIKLKKDRILKEERKVYKISDANDIWFKITSYLYNKKYIKEIARKFNLFKK